MDLHERSGSLRNFNLYAFFPSGILFGRKLLLSVGQVYEPAGEWAKQNAGWNAPQASPKPQKFQDFPEFSQSSTAKKLAMYSDKLAPETEPGLLHFSQRNR